MKVKKALVLVGLAVILSIGVFVFLKDRREDLTDAGPSSNVSLSFSVLGDIHGNGDKFDKILKDLYKVRRNMDVLVLNGDVVDQGLDNQYDDIKKVLKKNSSILPKTMIINIGNHEFFDYEKGPNTPEEVQKFISKYLSFSGEKGVYHDKWVKGYHFISLGSELTHTKELGSTQAFISDAQQKWLKEKLSENHVSGRPIFVFLHQHLRSTAPNGGSGWVGTSQEENIKKILAPYPEVILFTSHTHSSLETVNVTYDQPFTMAHTGAVHYVLERDEKGNRKTSDKTQGLYVEVNDNKVTIKGRDFKEGSWIFSKDVPK